MLAAGHAAPPLGLSQCVNRAAGPAHRLVYWVLRRAGWRQVARQRLARTRVCGCGWRLLWAPEQTAECGRAGSRIAKRESRESARAESKRENHAHAGAPRPSPRGRAHGFAVSSWRFGGLLCASHDSGFSTLELPFSVVGQGFCGGPACGPPVFACDSPLRPPRRHNGRRGEPR